MSQTGHPAMLAYPVKAEVSRIIPKTKFYELAAVNSRLNVATSIVFIPNRT